ncbi:NAD(P)/FAD-dependent oxidoreductase [Novosphingobium sp. Gsoil 351]|uniref:NAD(P)/FAD-dependent oxidoreductase n=1 Tax=Novosphingobium sp. Gsoil 351 TaxID=2675225 RepID=UPI0012B4A9B0|nr:aminoacetone oxidase family FAD-binding enzyme [Novosphingobium sp. Gsoil 351]
MCAAETGRRGRRVLVLEQGEKPGKKILISGGGRCNFTNLHTAADRFLSANPHFAKSALSRYTPHDFLALVERHGIAWHEKTLGQLFCDGSARQIVELLLAECAQGGVSLECGQTIGQVTRDGDGFIVATGRSITRARSLVVATGGPSIPKLGASGIAYDLARQFGLKVVEPRPALVPLTLAGEDALFRDLAGVATQVVARCGTGRFREAALFTHRGMSGPAILQVSSYWRRGDTVEVDFLPDAIGDWLIQAKQDHPRATLANTLRAALPARLADALAERLALPGPLAAARDTALQQAQRQLARWPFLPNGSEGFAKAEVTVGGVSTAELSSKTMEAGRLPGLYVIGEAVDVTGWLGGYNFQWAWASGWAAAQAL